MKDIKKLTVDSIWPPALMLTTRHHATRLATYWYCTGGRVLHTGIAQVAARAAKPYTQYVPSELCKQSTRTFSLLVKLY